IDIKNNNNLKIKLFITDLVEKNLSREEGILSSTGSIRAITGKYTGRSPKDRYVVNDDVSADVIDWGAVNQPIDEDSFERLYHKVTEHLSNKEEVFSLKAFAGADEKYRLPVEVINEYAWHNLFARQLFITPTEEEYEEHDPGFTILSAPTCKADPSVDGTAS